MRIERHITGIFLTIVVVTGGAWAGLNVPLGDAIRNRNIQIYQQLNLNTLPSPAEQGASEKRFFEGHWHGLEVIRLSRELRQEYDIPDDINGLLIDEVTLEATECGFLAGDVVQSVAGYPILTLKDFLKASMKVQNDTKVKIVVYRSLHAQALSGDVAINDLKTRAHILNTPQKSKTITLVLQIADYYNNLGYANMDAAPPIQPGAISPHKDRGRKCADCHVFMNTGGQLAVDAGDIVPDPPAIMPGSPSPHEDRGQCNFCHRIISPKYQNRAIQDPNTFSHLPRGTGAAFAPTGSQLPLDTLASFVAAQNPSVVADSQMQIPDTTTIVSPSAQALPIDTTQGPGGVMWMGVEAVTVTPEMSYQLNLPIAKGVFVYDVRKDSPIRYLGLKRGDVIVRLGQIPVQNVSHFNDLVVRLKPGSEIDIGVLRHGKQYSFHYILSKDSGLPERFKGGEFTTRAVGIVVVVAFMYFLVFYNILGRMISFALGAVLVVVLGFKFEFYTIAQALRAINFSVLMFIVGMNFIIAVLHETGFFDNLAGRIIMRTKQSRLELFLLFCLLTFALAAVLENIAVILVIVPLTLRLAKSLRFDPKPLVIAVIISSNIGGASTMIGDIPNLLIALSTRLRFIDFILYLAPCCIILLCAMFAYIWFSHNSFFTARVPECEADDDGESENHNWIKPVANVKATIQALIVLGIAIVGMVIAAQSAGIIALAGGLIVLFMGGIPREKILKHAGWSDVVFFASLFIVVGAFEASGFLYFAAHEVVLKLASGNILAMAITIMCLAAVITAFMNAGPTTAMFIPVVAHFGIQTPNNLFWWALSLGVLCGSSASLYGASGGPLASSILAKYWKKMRHEVDTESPFANLSKKLDMGEYLKTGIPIMGIFLVISIAYISVLHFYF